MSVGEEAFVTHWDVHLSRGAIVARGRAASALPALFAVLPVRGAREGPTEGEADGSRLFVAGAAPQVDCFLTPSSRTYALLL